VNRIKALIAAGAVGEVVLAIVLYNVLSFLPAYIRIFIIACTALAVFFAEANLLHMADDDSMEKNRQIQNMISEFDERCRISRRDRLPFLPELQLASQQLRTLTQKQNALRELLKDSQDSPFLSVGNDVTTYILTNCKHILSRVIIYGPSNNAEVEIHRRSLRELIADNARVLTDFEKLLVEISQIGDDITAETPCLNELTEALRSVRQTGDDDDWQQPQPPQPQQMQQF